VRNYGMAQWVAALMRSGFAIEGITTRKLRMEFTVWTARTRTSPAHAAAIRSLQDGAPAIVREHFGIEADGSFDIETATIVVHAA